MLTLCDTPTTTILNNYAPPPLLLTEYLTMTGNAFGCIIASATIYVTAAAPGSIHSHVLQSIIQPSSVLKPSTLTVPVDHYNKRKLTSETWEMRYWYDDSHLKKGREGKTWEMRYWYDDSHLKKGREGSKPNAGAPVFLQMGGEGEAGPAGGQQVELAGVHGAYVFSIEHRFYGRETTTFSINSRTLMGCTNLLRRECTNSPSVSSRLQSSYLIYADVRLHILMAHNKACTVHPIQVLLDSRVGDAFRRASAC